MTTALEAKMKRLEKRLKARIKPDGKPRRGYEQNVPQIRAQMELISERIEFARKQAENNSGE